MASHLFLLAVMVSGALVSAGPARSGYYGAKRFQVKQQQPENRGDLDWPEFDGFQDYPSYGSQYGSTLGREGAAQAEPEPAYYDTSYPATYEQQDYHDTDGYGYQREEAPAPAADYAGPAADYAGSAADNAGPAEPAAPASSWFDAEPDVPVYQPVYPAYPASSYDAVDAYNAAPVTPTTPQPITKAPKTKPTKATKAPKASKNKNKGSASTPAGLRAPPPPFQPLAPLNFDADAVSDDVKVRQETGLFRMIPVINVPLLEGQTPEEATLPEVPMVTAHRLEPKKTLKNGVKILMGRSPDFETIEEHMKRRHESLMAKITDGFTAYASGDWLRRMVKRGEKTE